MNSHEWQFDRNKSAWSVERFREGSVQVQATTVVFVTCSRCGMKAAHDLNSATKVIRGEPLTPYRELLTAEEDCESMTVRLVMSE